jgi:2-polyprenyl-6-methoxyphenol hydroxylase-like FAD-dependent oxidoreductase
LSAIGFPEPPESRVEAQVQYVTRLFRADPDVLPQLDADVVGTDHGTGLSGVALRQEDGLWTVTLTGQFGQRPPLDLPGYLDYARRLPTAGLAEIIERCEPVGDALPIAYPVSRWRHWERLDRRLDGFIALGDAVATVNPVFGQGMSSAAQQAHSLAKLLAEGGFADLSARTARAFAEVVETPWAIATGADRRFGHLPPKPLGERLTDRYLDRLLAVATGEPAVATAFGRVLHLLAGPSSLLTPRLLWRVLGPGSRSAAARARVTA